MVAMSNDYGKQRWYGCVPTLPLLYQMYHIAAGCTTLQNQRMCRLHWPAPTHVLIPSFRLIFLKQCQCLREFYTYLLYKIVSQLAIAVLPLATALRSMSVSGENAAVNL